MGVTLKVPFLVLNPISMEELLAGKRIDVFITGTYTIMVAILLFVISYLFFSVSPQKPILTFKTKWRPNRILFICLVLTIITLTCALLAINSIGISSLLSKFSEKRFLELEGAGGRLGSSLYVYYKVALFAKTTAYISLVYILLTPKTRKYSKLIILMLIISLLISTVIPTIFNARAQAILVCLDMLIIAYFSGIRLRYDYILAVSGAAYGIIAYTTLQRVGDERYTSVIESIISRRYLLDITKTAQIFDHFKENDAWFYGETLIGWLFIIVPSSIYPNKPMFVEMGKWIGTNIFGYDISGVPPGYVGELYLNFGWPGLLIGMPLMGIIIGLIWRWFIPRTLHPIALLVGSMVIVRFSVFLFNNDFGTFMIKIALEILPIVIFLLWISKTVDKKRQISP
ncbi:MAG: oligosaccharide repeat unit polymerase [Nitratireductor sp.]